MRAWWWHRQGLDGSLAGASPAEVLDRAGWARSVGGSNPYLTLVARAGTSRVDANAVVAALVDGPRDPAALRAALGDSVRNLGPDGKKKGMTTTLPVALGLLQAAGEIRRIPVDGRLDQQRYSYVAWVPPTGSGRFPATPVGGSVSRRTSRTTRSSKGDAPSGCGSTTWTPSAW